MSGRPRLAGARSAAGLWEYTQYLQEYYVLNVALLASWAFVRGAYAGTRLPAHSRRFGLDLGGFETFETHMALAALCLTLVRGWRARCRAAMVPIAFAQGYFFLCVVTFFRDPKMCAVYVLAIALLQLLVQQPPHRGPDASITLTPVTFKEVLHSGSSSARGAPAPSWVVMLHTPWSDTCRQMGSAFADLANAYSCSALQFGKLDIEEWPQVRCAVVAAGATRDGEGSGGMLHLGGWLPDAPLGFA